jgi:hypothetical protein
MGTFWNHVVQCLHSFLGIWLHRDNDVGSAFPGFIDRDKKTLQDFILGWSAHKIVSECHLLDFEVEVQNVAIYNAYCVVVDKVLLFGRH